MITIPAQLHVDGEVDVKPEMQRLLDAATAALHRDPGLVRVLNDGTFRLAVPLPAGYQRSMNHRATHLSGRFSQDGWLFEISEESAGTSGGWMASCIPPSLYRVFLKAWVQMAQQPAQRDLFGDYQERRAVA